MNFGTVDYASTVPPEAYRCGTCGAHGCKLWREWNTCADYITLECCDCAAKSQKEDVSDIGEDGKYTCSLGMRCDQIGMRAPAVPTEEGDTYWGYTSVPGPGVAWWKRLSTRVASTGAATSAPKVQKKSPPPRSAEACPVHRDPCPIHEYIHGAEAEELREGIESLFERSYQDQNNDRVVAWTDLQALLDSVDARDSCAFTDVETAPARKRRKAAR